VLFQHLERGGGIGMGLESLELLSKAVIHG
jgi:hypothetical protein